MKIVTYHFGEVEFEPEKILQFKDGLFGFEEYHKFLLIKVENSIYYWLNSIEDPEVAFPLINLEALDDQYPKEPSTEVFGMVTLNSNPLKVTVNMKAPVYINKNNNTGFQKILDLDKYSIHYKLFREVKETA
ncbi:flagellar assembly protein FliW [Melioribacteraceae bacterium 4301-Me]|uniref:flagellar assembly protein FliW n=1 Tax=Pyranulibacter aquaticus TaxID=3163344 RepID=UPI00359655B3